MSTSSNTTSRRRVVMAAARYLPLMGGIETHVHEVGTRLARRGWEVTVLTSLPPGNGPAEEEREGLRIVRLPIRAFANSDFYVVPDIARRIAAGGWDLVHVQGCHTAVPPFAMLGAQRGGLPYVVTFHTGGHSQAWRNRIRALQWWLLRPLFAGARKLIGVSRFEATFFQRLLRLPAAQFTVIPNGGLLPPPPGRPPFDDDGLIIASVGRLERYKGHHRVIAALPAMLRCQPNARVWVVGAGPYEGALRALAEREGVADRVRIFAVPPADRAAMSAVYARADVVALLSDYEAHPVAVMEALALRRPVVVMRTSGLAEIAEEGLAGAVDRRSSPEEIAETLLAQVGKPPPPYELPTWDRCVQQLELVYFEALAAR
ncbi:MAG: glycosyltransferase family 4 protein [Chloroflexota bacterium]|nr:glycosyltransferase family 4 protein [Dehalococcoidia bacterium]MDW8252956.1 glycosyltransferase family 4 protein [Chloroflexota bacterium]